MRAHALMIVTVSLLVAADAPQEDKAKTDLDKLQGMWKQAGLEHSNPLDGRVNTAIIDVVGGQTIEYEGKNIKVSYHGPAGLEVKGDKFFFRYARQPGKPPTDVMKVVKIDPTKDPKTIDLLNGEEGEGALRAIYELKGDTLTICFADGKARPGDFQIPPPARSEMRERILVRYTRVR